MKLFSNLNQIALVALVVTGFITAGAILARYPGLVEMQCSTEGCRVVIDGRS